MLRFKDVCFRYQSGEFEVKNVSFEIPLNGVTVLKGENANGKTTIAKLIAGILKPKSGDILFNEESLLELSLSKIGTKIAYLFQEPSNQLFAVNVVEELTFVEQLKGNDNDKATQKAIEILKKFNLENKLQQNVITLSKGEKQRLAMAAFLMSDPQLFVLDEPTTGLDIKSIETLVSVIQRLVQDGKGFVVISHDREFVEMLCKSKTLVIDKGVVYDI